MGKDGRRRVCAAVRTAPNSRNAARAVLVPSPLQATSWGPLPAAAKQTFAQTCRYRTAGRGGRGGAAGPRPPCPVPPAGERPQPPAQPAPATGRRDTHRRALTPTRAPARPHLLDVLPDGGAVVADDEQLQGVIDEAVLRGRARRRHGQAPSGGDPQHPTPPHPTLVPVTPAGSTLSETPPLPPPPPPKTKGWGPAPLTVPPSQADSAPSLPPRAQAGADQPGPDQPSPDALRQPRSPR